MKFFDLLGKANSNLLRNKARTVLTVIAILIGAMTLTLTNGIGTGVKSYLNEQIGNLGATNVLFITAKGDKPSASSGPSKYKYDPNRQLSSGGGLGQTQVMLNSQDLTAIKAIPNITTAAPAHSPAADYIMGKGDKYNLALAEQFGTGAAPMVAGASVDNQNTQLQISVPISYVKPLGYTDAQTVVGQTVTIGITDAKGKQSTVIATVTGVQQKNLLGQSTAYGNTSLIERLNDLQNVGIPKALADTFQTAYAVFPSSLTPAQVSDIKDKLNGKGFSGQTIKDEESTLFTAINAIIIVLDIFGIITLLAATFGIINTLFMAVQERTKEIGLMKALGMSPTKIFGLFSLEAILIGFWGSLLGVGAAIGIGSVVNAVGKQGFLKDLPGLSLLTFPLSTVLSVALGIMLVAFLAGALPAFRASRKNPIDALRYE
jgi:putative ABC transport system permease protein